MQAVSGETASSSSVRLLSDQCCSDLKTKQAGSLNLRMSRFNILQTQGLKACLAHSKGGTQINTAYIERFNGTIRERLASLTRKCRHANRHLEPFQWGMYLIGCTYNLCWPHHHLGQTPARVAGLIDRELYLPLCWLEDQPRRREAGIPDSVRFQTKCELATTMVQRLWAAGVPIAWIVADTVYGGNRSLREWCEHQQYAYVLAVPY